ncbi:DUF1570 domain-containing protein [Altererythrobacter sp. C41]|uniref:DUF1570 domain-containing protein n=1 Tax=Altererythrobacter sp. C41 TaxID=2806021 RepID=UPI001933C836|nr:DUF1570 domain-containing protein [Altererythrobacter sp. C41]MBM0169072.1 DUF1570 domain-containing protein [Altererythrobacter sp. C41]
MKFSILKAAAAFIAVLVSGPAHAEWLEATSPHFTVVGDMSERELRERTVALEQYDAMLRYVLNAEEAVPVTVFIVSGLGAVQDALGSGARNAAGFYSATAQGANAVVPERLGYYREDFNPRVVLFHEYAHHMLLTNVEIFMPGWAQEGLAEMFATAKIEDDGGVVIGDKNDSRADEMFGAHRWSVERMLLSDFEPPKNPYDNIEKYSRGWALAHYLWMSGERPNQYGEFIAELNRTVDPVASGKKVFGDLDRLDSELDRYIRMHKYKLARFGPELIGKPAEVAIRRLSEGEAAMLDYRMTSTLGVTGETAGPLAAKARPVAARFPDSVPVQTWLAEIEYDAKNYDAAAAAADRVLAMDPQSLFAMVYKGRVAMQRALAAQEPALAKEARRWFLKANRIDPDHALPFMLYYDSFGAMGQTPPSDAVTGLYRAVTLVPQDTTLRIRAAVALLREGDVESARRIIAPAAFAAESLGENSALQLVKTMQETLDPEALLAKAAELKFDRLNEFVLPEVDGEEASGEDGESGEGEGQS